MIPDKETLVAFVVGCFVVGVMFLLWTVLGVIFQ